MTKETVKKIEDRENETEQNQEFLTLSEMLSEYGELSSRFNSLNEEEMHRIETLYNSILDAIEYVDGIHRDLLLIGEIFGEFLSEVGLYDEFIEYYTSEVRKRLGIEEGVH